MSLNRGETEQILGKVPVSQEISSRRRAPDLLEGLNLGLVAAQNVFLGYVSSPLCTSCR